MSISPQSEYFFVCSFGSLSFLALFPLTLFLTTLIRYCSHICIMAEFRVKPPRETTSSSQDEHGHLPFS